MSDDDKVMMTGQPICLRDKLLILGMVCIVSMALLLPVYAAAQNRRLELQKRQNAVLQIAAEEESRSLSSDIAALLMPQQALFQAQQLGIDIDKLSFDQIRLVVLEDEP